MAKNNQNIVKQNVYQCSFKTAVRQETLKRTAKFAPELIAEGFADGVSMEQGNLVKGCFDDPTNFSSVDPAANIHTDKFAMMLNDVDVPDIDPAGARE